MVQDVAGVHGGAYVIPEGRATSDVAASGTVDAVVARPSKPGRPASTKPGKYGHFEPARPAALGPEIFAS